MATVTMTPEALDLLQQYTIDVRDFTKASARYKVVLTQELVPQKGEAMNEEVIAATREAQGRLKEAWEEYLASAQLYFGRLAKGLVADLVPSDETAKPSTAPITPLDAALPAASAAAVVTEEAEHALPKPGSAVASVLPLSTSAPSPLSGPALLPVHDATAQLVIPSPGTTGLAGSANPLNPSRSSPLSRSSISSSTRQSSAATTQPPAALTLEQRAERMNDLCVLLDKWYVKHESTFQLPNPEGLAQLASKCVSSVSRLLRLLGLRIAYVCAGNATFLRAFIELQDTPEWVGQCGDREIASEVEGFLNLVERMTNLVEEDPKAFPRVPFGWLYRVSAFIDPHDAMPNLLPKRRSQAIRVALRLLVVSPAQATAASIHTTLLRCCLCKGSATREETEAVVKLLQDMFDNPKLRQYMRITDIAVVFSPFFETTSAPTPVAMQDSIAVMNLASNIIVSMLSSWVGIMWVACETTSLRALIDVLHLPGDFDKKMVIFTLFNNLLVRLAPHRGMTQLEPWLGAEEERRRRAAAAGTSAVSPSDSVSGGTFPNSSVLYDGYFTSSAGEAEGGDEDFIPTTKALGYHVMDPLLGRVLLGLAYHGLPMALMDMLQSTNQNRLAMETASQLLQDVFVLMDTLLPKATVQGLHEAFNAAVGRLANGGNLFLGGLTSQLFHSYKGNSGLDSKAMVDAAPGGANTPGRIVVSGVLGGGGQAASNSALGTLDMDDPTFVSMLRETHVEQNPTNFAAWDYDRLLALVQGPLRVIRRLRSAKGILKTLIAFYSPRDSRTMFFMRTFCSLKPDEAASPMCVLGIELVDLLLSTREGTVLLDEASFPQGIAFMLKEVRSGKATILTKERANARTGQSLLRMVGRLSCYANGLILMREYGIFSIIDELFSRLQGTRVTDPRPTDTLQEVCFQLLQYLFLSAVPNYGVCEDIRHTFREALRSSSNVIRLCAAMQLKKAVWRDLSTSMKWGIETLVQVLHDDFYSVVESAFKLLLNICVCSDEGLDYLISLFPTVLMESEMILSHAKQLHLDVLLNRIASRPSGFRFLQSYGWIEQELHRWEASESQSYILLVEKLQAGEIDFKAAIAEAKGDSRHQRHTRSYSGSMGGMYKPGGSPASPTGGYLPLLTADAAVSANFFPVHFAAVLCHSTEGCAMFKHSDLWTRSVKRVLEQPLPPDIVYDDSLSDESDSSEDSEDDTNVLGEGTHMVPVKPASLGGGHDAYGGAYGGNSMSRADNSFMQSSLANRRGGGGATGSYTNPFALGGTGGATGPAMKGTAGGANGSGNAAANFQIRGAWGVPWSTVEEPRLTAKELRQLQKGKLSRNDKVLLSAARGYKPQGRAFAMECVGDPLSLKDALMVVCQVGSSDAGFSLFRGVPDLLKRIIALCRFGSTMSVRFMGLLCITILARSKRGSEELVKAGYTVSSNAAAYVSADGIPYAVAFAHLKPSKSMSITHKVVAANTAARHAYNEYSGVDTTNIPRKVCDSVVALANPVSREAAKALLYKIMKRHPHIFTDTQVRRLCLDAASMYRMRHAERKFLADLLENAQINAAAPPKVRPLRR